MMVKEKKPTQSCLLLHFDGVMKYDKPKQCPKLPYILQLV